MTTGTVLDKIAAKKFERVQARLLKTSLDELKKQAADCSEKRHSFKNALTDGKGLAVIAEIKKASPSKGLIQPNFNPVHQAKAYFEAGASAVSVLTEEDFFQGSDTYLTQVKQAVNLPILRKDFIINEAQIYEAKILGASAVLLIAAMLSPSQLSEYFALTKSLGMDALTEVHNSTELEAALGCGTDIIGINNRDLKTFTVDLNVTAEIMRKMPPGKICVSESGIHTHEDVSAVRKSGVKAVLIGESLMRAQGDVKEKWNELFGACDG